MILPETSAVDFDFMSPLLAQGEKPPGGTWLRQNGFRAVVLAAMEHQPPDAYHPGVFVIRARLDDAPRLPTNKEWQEVERASIIATRMVRDGMPVYISCYMGKNRSGLVMGRTLTRVTGRSGRWAADFIRQRRPGALSNTWFRAALDQIPRTERLFSLG